VSPYNNKKLLFLVGATAVGKTAVALELAERLGSEIINADSRQVYRGMDIGTSRPTPAEQTRVRHHLLDLVNPDERFSAGIYKRLAEEVIEQQRREGRLPFIVGGTGLYLKALAYGLWAGPHADWRIRSRWLEEQKRHGEGYLHQQLYQIDPVSAARIHPRDSSKIIRALEVFELEGKPLSYFHEQHRFQDRRWKVVWIGLRRSRQDLYPRIEQRVDQMLAAGMIEEVKRLLANGYSEQTPAMLGLGYRHLQGYLHGAIPWEVALQQWKRDTKRFAKRQETWFKAEPAIHWFDLEKNEPVGKTADRILEWLAMQLTHITCVDLVSAPASRVPGEREGEASPYSSRGGICVQE
jgi:tRNA dimethylallyltransferase